MQRLHPLIPDLVWYTDFYDCTIPEALLSELQRGPLTLPAIGNLRVNGHRLLGSYGEAIMRLRRLGYNIETVMVHKNKHTESMYRLNNPTFNHK